MDGIMTEWKVSNHDLVKASSESLTHKQVARARKGRRLTPKMQGKIIRALNALSLREEAFSVEDLFSY